MQRIYSFYLFREVQQLLSIQLVIAGDEARQFLSDLLSATNGVALNIQRQQRIVQRKPKQEPAIAVNLVQVNTNTFVIAGSEAPAFLGLGISGQLVNDTLTIGLEVIQQNVHAELHTLSWFFQRSNERFQRITRLLAASQFNEKLCNNISAIIQEIVLLECAVTGGLDGQLAVLTQAVQPDVFITILSL